MSKSISYDYPKGTIVCCGKCKAELYKFKYDQQMTSDISAVKLEGIPPVYDPTPYDKAKCYYCKFDFYANPNVWSRFFFKMPGEE